MKKLKLVIIVEAIIILILAGFLIYTFFSFQNNSTTQQVAYCDRHYYDSQVCLLSPRVYTGILKSGNFLIMNFKPLQENIQDYISANNLNVSVYVLNMRDSASFGINSIKGFEPASLNKLPVAILILKKIEQKELSLNSFLSIKEEDRDNKSGTLYNTSAKIMTVRELLQHMLSESDNTAFKVLGKQITLEDLQKLSVYLNYYTQNINYTPPILNNSYQITPKSTSNLFMSLYLSSILTPEDSELILKYLSDSTFDISRYAKLPDNILIAQKYGTYYANNMSDFHDCGIMYINDSRIFYSIMTQGMDEEKAPVVIGDMVNKIYNYVVEEKIKNNNLEM
jgi:beta-lactamase class A